MLAVVAFSSTALADMIPIGQLQWVITDPNSGGQFSVINQTGANSQAPDFPVLTQLLFDADMNLAVTFGNALGSANLTQADMTSPDAGLSWDSDIIGGRFVPILAVLTGSVSPLLNVTLDGGGLWNIVGGLFTLPGALGNGVDPIDDGETAIIYVEAQRVPEPATMVIFATGVAGFFARRRIVAKR